MLPNILLASNLYTVAYKIVVSLLFQPNHQSIVYVLLKTKLKNYINNT